MFRSNISLPFSGSKNEPSSESMWKAVMVSCSACSSNLKKETIFSSETSVDFQRTTSYYIPVDSILQRKPCLRSLPVCCVVSLRDVSTIGRIAVTIPRRGHYYRLSAVFSLIVCSL
jgi:hypothetical protein